VCPKLIIAPEDSIGAGSNHVHVFSRFCNAYCGNTSFNSSLSHHHTAAVNFVINFGDRSDHWKQLLATTVSTEMDGSPATLG